MRSMSCGENVWLAPSFIQIPSVCVSGPQSQLGVMRQPNLLNPSFPFWPIEGHQWPSCSPMNSGLDTIIPWSRRPGSTAMSPFPQLSALRSCWVSAVSRGCPEKNFQDMLERNKRKKNNSRTRRTPNPPPNTGVFLSWAEVCYSKSPVVKQTWHTRKQTWHPCGWFPNKRWVSIAMFDGLKVQADKSQLLLG